MDSGTWLRQEGWNRLALPDAIKACLKLSDRPEKSALPNHTSSACRFTSRSWLGPVCKLHYAVTVVEIICNGQWEEETWQMSNSYTPCYHPKPRTGRTANDHRPLVNGILWILRTGAPWKFTCRVWQSWHRSSQFYRWQQAGCGNRGQTTTAGRQRGSDWLGGCFVDATVVRAQSCRRGVRGQEHLPGISRGGFSTKVHVRAFGLGKPMVFALTAGERHETTVFDALMAVVSQAHRVQVTYLNLPDRILVICRCCRMS